MTPFAVSPPETLYHYCSNASFLSIISNRVIWASEFTLSNDTLEGKWIRNVIEECCQEKGLNPSQLSMVLKLFDAATSRLGGAGICLSENGDLLSQWRAYSQNGAGVAIGLNPASFVGPPRALGTVPVIYDPDTQKRIIAPNIDQISNFFRSREVSLNDKSDPRLHMSIVTLLPLLFSFKNPAFCEEKEWRIGKFVSMVPRSTHGEADEFEAWNLNLMEYRALPDRIVPYRPLTVHPEWPSITEVVLGPRNITPILVVEECLRHYGWTLFRVRKSSASYR
jgi:hypothetical protein